MHQVLRWTHQSTRKKKTWETTQAVAVLNSQILYHRILGFGATTTQKQEARRGRPARGTRKSNNTRRGGRQDTTAQQSYLIHIQISFFGTRNSYTITSSLLRTRRIILDPYSSTITKLSTHCTAAVAFLCFKKLLVVRSALAELLLCSKSSSLLLLIFWL